MYLYVIEFTQPNTADPTLRYWGGKKHGLRRLQGAKVYAYEDAAKVAMKLREKGERVGVRPVRITLEMM